MSLQSFSMLRIPLASYTNSNSIYVCVPRKESPSLVPSDKFVNNTSHNNLKFIHFRLKLITKFYWVPGHKRYLLWDVHAGLGARMSIAADDRARLRVTSSHENPNPPHIPFRAHAENGDGFSYPSNAMNIFIRSPHRTLGAPELRQPTGPTAADWLQLAIIGQIEKLTHTHTHC